MLFSARGAAVTDLWILRFQIFSTRGAACVTDLHPLVVLPVLVLLVGQLFDPPLALPQVLTANTLLHIKKYNILIYLE
jgi:hypothetical protein